MNASAEVEAMGTIEKTMIGLKDEEAQRVLRWANDRFGGDLATAEKAPVRRPGAKRPGGNGGADETQETFERISDLMDAAGPSTGVERVLVGSYWFQVLQGEESVTGQQVNAELKDLGHPVSNITDAFGGLMKQKPGLARQVQKSGTSRQARKKYRLTDAGIRRVQKMLASEDGE